jgi:hypothetical protein
MTSISRSFTDGAAMLLFMNSRKSVATSQDEVDKIVDIVRSSQQGTVEIDAEFEGAQMDTTDGDESDDPNVYARTFGDARIKTGGGNDDIGAHHRSVIASGSGDDHVTTYDYGNVDSGAGDDYVYGSSYMRVEAGGGNDEIRTSGYSIVDAGDGDDLAVTLGYSKVNGGAGNDTLIAVDRTADHSEQAGHAVLAGGDGDDDIQIGRNSVANGGTGNDKITLMREGSTVEFARGDGHDKVFSADDFTLAISGYSKDDITLTKQDGNLVVSFAGSDDTITINLPDGKSVSITFADGTEMTVVGADESFAPTFSVKWTSPEWRNALPYHESEYSGTDGGYTLADEYDARR